MLPLQIMHLLRKMFSFFSLQMISVKNMYYNYNLKTYLLILYKESGLIYLFKILKVSEESHLLLWLRL